MVTSFKETNLNIGIDKPFSIMHLSDTHLTYADERNDERKIKLAEARAKVFIPEPEKVLSEAEVYARENSLPIVYTGDLIDFVSEANLDRAKSFIDNNDVLFIAGNHEFSLYVGEAKEDEAYRNQSLAHVQQAFKADIRFNSRVINGVNFVGIDNGYYLFEKSHLELLKKEVAKGLPIVLYFHTPIYTKELFDYSFMFNKGYCAYLVGVADELLSQYDPYRAEQQRPNTATLEFIDYIKEQPLIKCILTGHFHYDFECHLTESIPQILTGSATVRVINIT